MGETPGERQGARGEGLRLTDVARLVVRFLIAAPLCLVLWWLMLPAYAWFVGHLAVFPLVYLLGIPVEAVTVARHGILNTGTELAFVLEGVAYPFPAGVPVLSTIVSFTILVLATPGLALRRRLRAWGIGSAVLFAVQLAFLVTAFAFRHEIAQHRRISASITEVSFALPFLLWAVLAYRDKLMTLIGGASRDSGASDEVEEAPNEGG